MNLKQYFDRVVLINLKRRPDRLDRVRSELMRCRWPFKEPEIFEAVDGLITTPPPHWEAGRGAWGCLQSHYQVLTLAIKDGVKQLLVLEDDIYFAEEFRKKAQRFLQKVPDDWDQLMLGGQHMNHTGEPTLVKPGILRCTDCERTHCYAIRGEFMHKLSKRWISGGKYNGSQHCDWIMGRDRAMQYAHKVYAPELFIVGQERGSTSDIFSTGHPRRIWNPPKADRCVINLHAPANVVSALRHYGLCTGDGLQRKGDLGEKLMRIFEKSRGDIETRIKFLRNWINVVQWELAEEPTMTCTVWHPDASLELVKSASLWRVYDIRATSIKQALRQLPAELRALHKYRHTDCPWLTTSRLSPRKLNLSNDS